MNEQAIKALEEKGFRRWQKGNFDRLYVNAYALGLVLEHYKTGNVSNAYFQGERVSNSEDRRMYAAKTWVDVKTGTVYGDNPTLKKAAEECVAAASEGR